MPPTLLFDLAAIDLDATIAGPDRIREVNPQRGNMEHLDAIVWHQEGKILGYKDVTADEFWVPGHIPGRPLLPGVIMLEAAAQLSSYLTRVYVGWEGFIGFGGLEDVKFRAPVEPGQRLYLLADLTEVRHRRIRADFQGVVNGNVAVQGVIIGTKMG